MLRNKLHVQFLLPVLAKFNLTDSIFHSKYIVSDWLLDLHNSPHLPQPHSDNQYHKEV